MNKIFNIFKVLFVIISLYGCHDSKEIKRSVIFIDCSHIRNNLGYVNGLIIKQDSILSCVKTNTVDESIFRYSFYEREQNDFEDFVGNLTLLADEYDQSDNKYIVGGGESYTLIIKNDSIQKKYFFYSSLMTDSLFEKIKIFKDYSKSLDFKPINKFTFPIDEMCIDTIPEPNPFG